MDQITNPYTPGAGSPPPDLAGRDRELEAFTVAVKRLTIGRSAKSQLLTGLRGVGKTVLLREFGRIARGLDWVHSHVEATEELDFVEGISTLIHRALLRLSTRRRIRDRVRRAWTALSAFRVRYEIAPAGGRLVLEKDLELGLAGLGILDEDLADLFIEVGETARDAGVGVLLTIDEMQHLSRKDLAALIVALHRVSQEQLPLMAAGAGLPSLPGLAGEAKSYAERLFDYPNINSLTREYAGLALSRPAIKENVSWTTNALDEVFSLTEGYPYFLQEFGKQAWDIAAGPDRIDQNDVKRAKPIALSELDHNFFRTRLARVSEGDRNYLRGMASLGSGPYRTGEVAQQMGKPAGRLGPVRHRLIKRGLIYSPRWGLLDFTVPMFDDYIRRVYGLATNG